MVFLLAGLFGIVLNLQAQNSPDEEQLRIRTRKVDNWIVNQTVDFRGYQSITLNCGDRLVTLICDETRRACGPYRKSLQDAFRDECQPHLIKFYNLDKQDNRKGRKSRSR